MKIKVADLEPNPFRDFENYPIDRERVEGLKDSFFGDEFWGGIPIRPHPTKKGKYQIGGGHHRLVSLQENNIEEIEVSCCKNYPDWQMKRIMVNENAHYSDRPKLVNSDIELTKKTLDAKLAKYKTWGDMATAEKNLSGRFPKDPHRYGQLRKKGTGRGLILTFLGKTWAKKGWMIQSALATLSAEKEGIIDREAIDILPSMDNASIFRGAVKKYNISKPTQKKIAKKIVKEEVPSKDIPDLVAEHSKFPIPNLKKKKSLKPRKIPNVVEFVFKCENDTDSLNHRLRELCPEVAEIANKGRLLGRLVPALKGLGETISEVVDKYERTRSGKESGKKEVASVEILD